jgi:predicted dehydrogenase
LEACIAVGKPLLVEKPLAATVEEGRRMAEAAQRAGLPTTVSQNYRWLPGPFVARALIEQGRIGTPFFGSFEIHGTQDRDLKDHRVYSKDLDFITVQWNTHLTDLLRHMLGRDATRVFAQTRRSPGQHFLGDNLLISAVEFGRAATGHVLHSELARSGMTEDRFRIDGDLGTITGGIFGPWVTLDCESTGRVEIDVSGIPGSYSGPMGDLLACVESGEEPALSFRRNLPTLMCVRAEFESAQSGGRWMELGG